MRQLASQGHVHNNVSCCHKWQEAKDNIHSYYLSWHDQ